jgi:hypothetical protein
MRRYLLDSGIAGDFMFPHENCVGGSDGSTHGEEETMSTIKATWQNGQIVPEGPVSWHEGCRLEVREEPPATLEFMTEEEQSGDPEEIQRWIDELRAIPPLPMTLEQEAELLTWRQKMKEFNLDAVRRQMEEGIK